MTKKPLTDAQRRLIELDAKKPEIDKYYEDLDQAVKDVVAEIGVNSFFQSDDNAVFKMVRPVGTFVSYKEFNYNRTKRIGDTRGSLSVKEAVEAGYVVPKE